MNRATEAHTIASLLAQASAQLPGDSARLDAEVLLSHALDKPRSHLHAWPERVPAADARERFLALLARRARGEPVAYLTGQREFWSLNLAVSPDTLIPRPETETLVDLALQALPAQCAAQVVDLGTGSGAIALALASERPGWQITATDRSPSALELAQHNARTLQLQHIEFLCGDWFAPIAERTFDLIVSNPPYVAAADHHLDEGDVRFEPRSALTSGHDGLDAIRTILAQAGEHLHDNGAILLEHGFDQGASCRQLLQNHGFIRIQTQRDHAGLERVTSGRKPAVAR